MIETIIGHFQHRTLSTWLILDQVFAGRRLDFQIPGFPNSFLPSWDPYFVSQKFTHQRGFQRSERRGRRRPEEPCFDLRLV